MDRKISSLLSVIAASFVVQVFSEKIDFKSIFHTPQKKYDEFEILERSSFEPDDPSLPRELTRCITERPRAIANAQVLVNFDSEGKARGHNQCESIRYPFFYYLPHGAPPAEKSTCQTNVYTHSNHMHPVQLLQYVHAYQTPNLNTYYPLPNHYFPRTCAPKVLPLPCPDTRTIPKSVVINLPQLDTVPNPKEMRDTGVEIQCESEIILQPVKVNDKPKLSQVVPLDVGVVEISNVIEEPCHKNHLVRTKPEPTAVEPCHRKSLVEEIIPEEIIHVPKIETPLREVIVLEDSRLDKADCKSTSEVQAIIHVHRKDKDNLDIEEYKKEPVYINSPDQIDIIADIIVDNQLKGEEEVCQDLIPPSKRPKIPSEVQKKILCNIENLVSHLLYEGPDSMEPCEKLKIAELITQVLINLQNDAEPHVPPIISEENLKVFFDFIKKVEKQYSDEGQSQESLMTRFGSPEIPIQSNLPQLDGSLMQGILGTSLGLLYQQLNSDKLLDGKIYSNLSKLEEVDKDGNKEEMARQYGFLLLNYLKGLQEIKETVRLESKKTGELKEIYDKKPVNLSQDSDVKIAENHLPHITTPTVDVPGSVKTGDFDFIPKPAYETKEEIRKRILNDLTLPLLNLYVAQLNQAKDGKASGIRYPLSTEDVVNIWIDSIFEAQRAKKIDDHFLHKSSQYVKLPKQVISNEEIAEQKDEEVNQYKVILESSPSSYAPIKTLDGQSKQLNEEIVDVPKKDGLVLENYEDTGPLKEEQKVEKPPYEPESANAPPKLISETNKSADYLEGINIDQLMQYLGQLNWSKPDNIIISKTYEGNVQGEVSEAEGNKDLKVIIKEEEAEKEYPDEIIVKPYESGQEQKTVGLEKAIIEGVNAPVLSVVDKKQFAEGINAALWNQYFSQFIRKSANAENDNEDRKQRNYEGINMNLLHPQIIVENLNHNEDLNGEENLSYEYNQPLPSEDMMNEQSEKEEIPLNEKISQPLLNQYVSNLNLKKEQIPQLKVDSTYLKEHKLLDEIINIPLFNQYMSNLNFEIEELPELKTDLIPKKEIVKTLGQEIKMPLLNQYVANLQPQKEAGLNEPTNNSVKKEVDKYLGEKITDPLWNQYLVSLNLKNEDIGNRKMSGLVKEEQLDQSLEEVDDVLLLEESVEEQQLADSLEEFEEVRSLEEAGEKAPSSLEETVPDQEGSKIKDTIIDTVDTIDPDPHFEPLSNSEALIYENSGVSSEVHKKQEYHNLQNITLRELDDLLKIIDNLDYIKLKLNDLESLQTCRCNKEEGTLKNCNDTEMVGNNWSKLETPTGFEILTPKSCKCFKCGQTLSKKYFEHDVGDLNSQSSPPNIFDLLSSQPDQQIRESVQEDLQISQPPDVLAYFQYLLGLNKPNFTPLVSKQSMYPSVLQSPYLLGNPFLGRSNLHTSPVNLETCVCGRRAENGRCSSCAPYLRELNG